MVYVSRGYTASSKKSSSSSGSSSSGSSSSRPRSAGGVPIGNSSQTTKRYSGSKLISTYSGPVGSQATQFTGPSYAGGTDRETIREGNREAVRESRNVGEGKAQAAGIQGITKRLQTEKKYRAGSALPISEQSTYETVFRDKMTGQEFSRENVPTQENFIPIEEVSDEELKALGLNEFEIEKIRKGSDPNLIQEVEEAVNKIKNESEGEEGMELKKQSFLKTLFLGPTMIDKKTGQESKLMGGSPSITGLGGAAATVPSLVSEGAAIEKTAGAAIKGTGAEKAISHFTKAQNRAIEKTAIALGVSANKVEKAVKAKLLQQSAAGIAKGLSAKTMAKWGLGGAGVLASVDVLTSWYALDNVIGGQKFFMNNLRNGIKDGTIGSEEALAAIEESKELREIAIKKVNASATYNPEMWAFRKLILAGVEGDQVAINLTEREIAILLQGGRDYDRQ